MGRKKELSYYNDRWKGSLEDSTCEILEQLIYLDEDNGCVPDLRHVIYDMNKSDVMDMIELYECGLGYQDNFERPRGTLRDYQTIGVAYLYHVKDCILGDSAGLGKTVISAGLINLLSEEAKKEGRKFRYLLLTEKSLATQLRFELCQFTGTYTYLLSSGEEKVINNFIHTFDIDEIMERNVVGTHALLTSSKFLGWLMQYYDYHNESPFDMIIIDESSVLGNSTSGITKGFKAINKLFNRRVFLNATPLESKLDIFYTQLSLIDGSFLPTKTDFRKEFCEMDYRGMYPKPTGRYKNKGVFRQRVAYRYFARTRKAKGAVMEDCKGRILLSPLSEIQKKWMNLTSIHRLVYDCPSHLDPSIEFTIENVPKLGSLDSLLKDECADADSILIFVPYKEAQSKLKEWLTNKGHSVRVLNGDITNIKDRESIIQGFKNKEYRILITSVQKGLNFGDCNHCIFYSFNPNPAGMIQFEARTTRSFDIIGKNVFVLCSMGKEYKRLNEVLKERARATADMARADISVIMSILLEEMD